VLLIGNIRVSDVLGYALRTHPETYDSKLFNAGDVVSFDVMFTQEISAGFVVWLSGEGHVKDC